MSANNMSLESVYEATVKSVVNGTVFGLAGVYVNYANGKEGFISVSHLKLTNKQTKMFNSGRIPEILLPSSQLKVKVLRSSLDGNYNDCVRVI